MNILISYSAQYFDEFFFYYYLFCLVIPGHAFYLREHNKVANLFSLFFFFIYEM